MSLLVNCPKCDRVYDASGRAIDSRFRCHCGEVVTVQLPKETNGHDAAVVRCSSCGAPRKGNASSCTYCHADFTLHEQDLHTVCPKCFARVSDKASFCHSCGESLQGESCASLATDLSCPNCEGVQLQQREFGNGKQLFECPACTGMWVRNGVLKELLKDAKKEADEFSVGGGPARPLESTDNRPEHAPIYKECPDCGHHMRRHIFAQKSGIVIDSCKEHGVWFDPNELEMILNWVREGGSATGEDQAVPRPSKSSSESKGVDIGYVRTERSGGSPLADVLDEAFEAISRYFFR